MFRRSRLFLVGLLPLLVTSVHADGGSTREVADQPNVVVILTDDQGWGDLSISGNGDLETPNIDSLAKDGASFSRFFVCPVCSPTRAEFLTGRYHPRSGVYSTSAGGERMDLDETTIADTFKAAGYRTAAFGKWHNGMQYPYHPTGRGFDESYGFCSGHWGNYFDPPLEHNGRLVKGNGFVIDDFTERAMDFMEQHRDEPFFIYLPYNTPHSPMQVPTKWWNRFRSKELKQRSREPGKENLGHTRAALAMCENIDWNVGRLQHKLDELGIAENTILVYFCDNGPNGWRWNGGMRGRKGSTDEGGVRSPLLVRWPGTIPAGRRITPIGAAIDLLPTLSELAGIEPAGEKPLDGVSFKPLLVGGPRAWPERMIFSHWRNRVSARTQRYRFDHQGRLYDMIADPGQQQNIAAEHPRMMEEFQQAVTRWRSDVLDGYDDDERPFLIGHPDYELTQIPARDGIAHGSIERSNRFPNCSYFRNWTDEQDKVTWNVEVRSAGDYEVELYYCCDPEDVGASMELSFGDRSVQVKIVEANHPPVLGGENDRVVRQESYVRDFKPIKMGTISLDAGRGQLTLRAVDIPGSKAIDFRLLMFRKL